MSRLETFSEYVEKILARLQSGSRSNQNLILVREIADLRMQIATLANSVAALASYQEIAEQLIPDESGVSRPALPRSVLIDACQHLQLLDGFYALEYTEAGQAYRWTGPSKRFRFSAWIDRTGPIDVSLGVIFAGSLANILNTRLHVGELEYALVYSDSTKSFTASGIAPRRFHGVSVFEFELAGYCDNKDPNDLRELGLPFCLFEARAQPLDDEAGSAHG